MGIISTLPQTKILPTPSGEFYAQGCGGRLEEIMLDYDVTSCA